MKKLILLTLMVIGTLTTFSQSVTVSPTDTSKYIVPKPLFRSMIKDIIRGDSAIAENKILYNNIQLLKDNNTMKDSTIADKESIINLYKEKEVNFNSMVGLKDQQLDKSQKLSDQLAKDLKKEKRNHTFTKFISGVIIGFMGYLYVTK